MTTKRAKPVEFWDRDQINSVIDQISAGDLIDALREAKTDTEKATLAFDSAAERMGISNGIAGTYHVRAGDFKYLADQLGEAINVDSPLSEATSDSLDSADAGE